MQETGFDRQSFVAQHAASQKAAPSGHGLIILLALALLVGLLGFGVYKLSSENLWDGLQVGTSSNEVLARLEQIESRLVRLEKERWPVPQRAPSNLESQKGTTVSSPLALPRLASDAGTALQEQTTSKSSAPDPTLDGLREEMNLVQSNVGAGKEAWDAATDRLVDVIGELSEQRKEITEHQRDLDQWRALQGRERQPFRVNKRMDRVRFGPVSLRLLSTSADKQLYTMRVFVDDKAIEIRQRALYEPIQLYPARSSVPMELIVTEIGKDEVSGYLTPHSNVRKP